MRILHYCFVLNKTNNLEAIGTLDIAYILYVIYPEYQATATEGRECLP